MSSKSYAFDFEAFGDGGEIGFVSQTVEGYENTFFIAPSEEPACFLCPSTLTVLKNRMSAVVSERQTVRWRGKRMLVKKSREPRLINFNFDLDYISKRLKEFS